MSVKIRNVVRTGARAIFIIGVYALFLYLIKVLFSLQVKIFLYRHPKLKSSQHGNNNKNIQKLCEADDWH